MSAFEMIRLCGTTSQGIVFWETNTFDWQLEEVCSQDVEQKWSLTCHGWKHNLFQKAIEKSAWGQEITSRLACVTRQHELYIIDVAKSSIIWPIRKVQAYDITSLCFLCHDELLCIGMLVPCCYI